jgi:hypothetical protein
LTTAAVIHSNHLAWDHIGQAPNAEQRTLSDPGELNEVLTETMGIQLPVPVEEIWEKLPAEMVPQWP